MSGTILFAEDHEITLTSYTLKLERQGYSVLPYSDGRKAKEELEGGLMFDLALIDLSLPGIDGADLIRLIKTKRPSVPVVAISAYKYRPTLADRVVPKTTFLEPGDPLVTAVNELFAQMQKK